MVSPVQLKSEFKFPPQIYIFENFEVYKTWKLITWLIDVFRMKIVRSSKSFEQSMWSLVFIHVCGSCLLHVKIKHVILHVLLLNTCIDNMITW